MRIVTVRGRHEGERHLRQFPPAEKAGVDPIDHRFAILFREKRRPAADRDAVARLHVQRVADRKAQPEQALAQLLAHSRRARDRAHPFAAELEQFGFSYAEELGEGRKRRIGLDAAMMTAAAARPVGIENHMAELDRLRGIGLQRIVHPGAGNALADEDEEMCAAEGIVLRAAAVKRGVCDHRVGELDRHAGEHSAEHVADAFDVARNDRIARGAQAAEAGNGDADLRETDAAAARPVAQQGEGFAEHPADGLDGRLLQQRNTLGVVHFARHAANAHAEPLAGQLKGCERHGAIERHEACRTADIGGRAPHFLDQAFGFQIKQDARQARLGQAHGLGQRRPERAAGLEQVSQNGSARLPPTSRLLRHFHPCRHSYLV